MSLNKRIDGDVDDAAVGLRINKDKTKIMTVKTDIVQAVIFLSGSIDEVEEVT